MLPYDKKNPLTALPQPLIYPGVGNNILQKPTFEHGRNEHFPVGVPDHSGSDQAIEKDFGIRDFVSILSASLLKTFRWFVGASQGRRLMIIRFPIVLDVGISFVHTSGNFSPVSFKLHVDELPGAVLQLADDLCGYFMRRDSLTFDDLQERRANLLNEIVIIKLVTSFPRQPVEGSDGRGKQGDKERCKKMILPVTPIEDRKMVKDLVLRLVILALVVKEQDQRQNGREFMKRWKCHPDFIV